MARADDLTLNATTRITGPAIRFRTLLEGVWYGFALTYDDRDLRWRLTITDVVGTLQVDGLRVVEGRDLLAPFHHLAVPPGQLYVEDVEGLGRPPDLGGWSSYARMYYRPVAIVDAARGTADEVS